MNHGSPLFPTIYIYIYICVCMFFFFFWLRKLPEYYFLAQAFANLHGKRRQGKFI